jgi:predicted secreted protein
MDSNQVEHLKSRVGEPFTIRLRSDSTTGFGWQALYDASKVTLLGRSSQPEAGGEEALTFQATQPGTFTITLELRRPRDKGSQETRIYEVNVEP